MCRSQNADILQFLMENPDKINFDSLCKNPHPIAVSFILEKFRENTSINFCLSSIARNTNPDILEILKMLFLEKNTVGCGSLLSSNPIAMDIIRERPELINWDMLSSNPAIFRKVGNEGLGDFLDSL